MKNLLKFFVFFALIAITNSCQKTEAIDETHPLENTDDIDVDESNPDYLKHYVHAQKGLRVRASPSLDTEIINVLPYGNVVLVSQDSSAFKTESYEVQELSSDSTDTYTIEGIWKKIKYQKKTGYIFDGYVAPWPVRQEGRNSYQYVDENFEHFSMLSRHRFLNEVNDQFGINKNTAYFIQQDANDPAHRFLLPMTSKEAYLVFVLGNPKMKDIAYELNKVLGRVTHTFTSGDYRRVITEYNGFVLLEEYFRSTEKS